MNEPEPLGNPHLEVHVLSGADAEKFLAEVFGLEAADEDGNPEPKVDKSLKKGDRVKEVDGQRYGHVLDICECPMSKALESRCMDVLLHENCGGDKLIGCKEYRWEHID